MSPTAYAAYATIYAALAFGHGLLAWTDWNKGVRTGKRLNYKISMTVFFAGTATWFALMI